MTRACPRVQNNNNNSNNMLFYFFDALSTHTKILNKSPNEYVTYFLIKSVSYHILDHMRIVH